MRAGAQCERVRQRPDALPLQLGVLLQARRADLEQMQVLRQPVLAGLACAQAAPQPSTLSSSRLSPQSGRVLAWLLTNTVFNAYSQG